MRKNPDMNRRHVTAILSFALVFMLLFAGVEKLLFSDLFFSGTWTRLREEKNVPQVLILGNSHAFCSFVPQVINGAAGVDSAVLGASGQNAAGAVDSFEAALRVGTPEIVVAELNAFLTDYDAMGLYHKGSALSNINGMPHLWQRVKSAWHELGFESIPQGAFQLLRSDLMWARWNQTTEIDYAGDGTALLNWHATGVYDADAAQKLAHEHLAQAVPEAVDSRNERELRRLMELAGKHGVKVLLVKTPTIASSQPTCNRTVYLMNVAREYGDTLLGARDFHLELADMAFRVEDFYDNGHLSRTGAIKLSCAFSRWFGELAGKQVDFSRFFAYAGETVDEVGNGLWRYAMTAFGENVEYCFSRNGEVLQDWSGTGWIEVNLPAQEAGSITVSMREAARPEKEITMSFMTANTCEIR